MKLYISEALGLIDLYPFYKYIDWHFDQLQFFDMKPGDNHCRLLSYLSKQLPSGSKVADLGTFCGASAIALATNLDVEVMTFDLTNHLPNDKTTCKNLPNVRFIQADCVNYISLFANFSIVFLDVAPHDGIQEAKIFRGLQAAGFQGLLICDDIDYSNAMRNWWYSIDLKKYDVTKFGHWSGTGIVVFNPYFLDIEFS